MNNQQPGKLEVVGSQLSEALQDIDVIADLLCLTGNCVAKQIRETVIPGPPLVCTCGADAKATTCAADGKVPNHVFVGPPGYSPASDPNCVCIPRAGG